jgi:hypothetical protein
MFFRAAILILCITAIAGALLSIRRQQIESERAIAQTHKQIHETRRSLWEVQTRAAQQLKPLALEHRLRAAQMELEPISPTTIRPVPTTPQFATGSNH